MRTRISRSAVSACSAAARSFSPLCFTDSGFNSDSTQYPADRAAPKQVSSPNWTSYLTVPSLKALWPVYGPGLSPSSSFFACLFPLAATGHAIRVVLCVYVVVYGGAGPCSCTPGMGGFSGETCIVTAALKRTRIHSVNRTGEETQAAASPPVSSCFTAVVPLSSLTPILLFPIEEKECS